MALHPSYRDISPLALRSFLQKHEWIMEPSPFEDSEVWTSEAGLDASRILVPTNSRRDDYGARIADILRVVTQIYGETESHWFDQLLLHDVDVLRFSLDTNTASGTIGIKGGAALFKGIQDALRAAAKASISKSPHFGLRLKGAANELVGQARFGLTAPGSYIVTVFSNEPRSDLISSDRKYEDSLLSDHPLEMSRGVTSTLLKALKATRSVIDNSNTDLQDAVAEGVSADLCWALMNMTEKRRDLDVSVAWSTLIDFEEENRPPDSVAFSVRDMEQLGELAERLKISEITPDVEVRGLVIDLRRREIGRSGIIQVEATAFPWGHIVHMVLDPRAYLTALKAHEENKRVVAKGDLVLEGNRYWLHNVSSFESPSPPSSAPLPGS